MNYLSSKSNRLSTSTKARLNHSHKLDNIEPRKRSSPDESPPGPPSPSEVVFFNNANHSASGGRNTQSVNSPPDVPQADEIYRYFKDSWDRRMHEIETQNLKVLWIQSDRDDVRESQGSSSQGSKGKSSSHSQPSQQANRK